MAEEAEKEYLTVEDIEEDLGIGRSKAYGIFKRKDFPANRFVRPFKIHKDCYNEWKKQRHEREEE